MSFVQAKCPNCGGILAVDDAHDAAVCQFCNTPFIVEKAINNYNTTNNITVGAGAVVNVVAPEKSDFVIVAGKLQKYVGSSTKVEIPGTVSIIGEKAFADCSALEEITIPNSVKEIRDSAFVGCSNLKSIVIPEGVTFIAEYLFFCCSKLENVVLPNTIRKINPFAFGFCNNLKSITIPESVMEVTRAAFYECKNLAKVTKPARIPDKMFKGTLWYKTGR